MTKLKRTLIKWIVILILFIFITLIALTCRYADEIDEVTGTQSVLIMAVP